MRAWGSETKRAARRSPPHFWGKVRLAEPTRRAPLVTIDRSAKGGNRMGHRSGKTFRRTPARDHLLLLVLGIVLVLAALLMSLCEPSAERLGGTPALGGEAA